MVDMLPPSPLRIRERVSQLVRSAADSDRQGRRSSSDDRRPSSLSSSSSSGAAPGGAPPPQSDDPMFLRLRREAAEVVKREPLLSMLLAKAGLLDVSSLPDPSNSKLPYPAVKSEKLNPASTFEEAVSRIVAHRLSSCSGGADNCDICPNFLRHLLEESFGAGELEMGHTMSESVREDAMAVVKRDPAVETLLEVVLFMKGFHSLVIHRAARRAWKPRDEVEGNGANGHAANGRAGPGKGAGASGEDGVSFSGRRFVALLLQSQASAAFGVDIHPASSIGAGVMIDHASGVVIGETATVGDGTTILHGVTLGGTGKDHGDRHPKVGRDVLIGAGTKILGNITVGDRVKIGAGSVVLRPIPSNATAVGVPAKILGFTPKGEKPGSSVDSKLEGVEPLLGKKTSGSSSSTSITEATTDSGGSASPGAAPADVQHELLTPKVADDSPKETAVGKDDDQVQDKYATADEDSDEEDDNSTTDFGTPAKCHWVKVSNNDGLCPFSGSFRDVSSSVKQTSISHTQLRGLLIQEGCTEGECVEVFFELLHRTPPTSRARQEGCIPFETFTEFLPEIAREKTRLDPETINALARGDLRALGISKRASRRFGSALARLGKQSASIMARIPSTGNLGGSRHGGVRAGLRKSERERMEGHLDTSAFAEGITM